jgi:hypothetical protein
MLCAKNAATGLDKGESADVIGGAQVPRRARRSLFVSGQGMRLGGPEHQVMVKERFPPRPRLPLADRSPAQTALAVASQDKALAPKRLRSVLRPLAPRDTFVRLPSPG